MRIGDLRHRVTLQYEAKTADNMGGYTSVWTDAAYVHAAIWPVSATEQIQAAQTQMTVTHRIRMRYRPDLKASWRIKHGDRYFAIVSVIDPSERHAMVDVLAKEAAS